ncbi:uncharacterized protein MJAP1_003265 [Malassezia japonica]|uniref:Uncharacterized protein n=1 Tax=Malassezia japonica TaxID=223818 RepID=A0AAF0F5K0_9BASI|nr:uncharacterized protein MJAP1_003265 [Malassezia japonica]WFD40279.1 hypothetical protein MJAP1_003265 [Malassezia japonica]
MAGPEGENEERFWSLILDLSAQLTANRQASDNLKNQISDLQGQAVHAKSGYALRRFNVDLSQEAFTTELERLNVQLMQENTTLAHESKQLGALLRECEATLETVMGKFRSFSHAAQQYGLDLSAYYESRIEGQTEQLDAIQRQEYSGRDAAVGRLGTLVRSALRLVDGEDEEANGSTALERTTEIEQLRAENEMLRSLLGMGNSPKEESEVPVRTADLPATRAEVATAEPLTRAPIDEVDVGGASDIPPPDTDEMTQLPST